ncbi:MAG: TatD family nuclease-associated radical SAM protein [Candidatus Margulisbacteria bacterium]|nr:TatD family nuclease-associated radical SAM protein [Candidatus Margulisiibacteriota bacterium]MBU1022303.1 TatD family nuclease-associated radical SAM protein [Candidatus Margulisiibacteriota bacterium]MBU1729916.1 TatD family nuclease-associated radical SAM protein [Candidatus Margulisiibacteriota bacterium]MBU1955949.1 TatD family nuclease-associated radical SAM protein [Candidatus Margulisiibacteriota bacterium]
MSAITYKIRDSLYLNITNRCTNECTFCIRYISKRFNGKHPLWLTKEPSEEELLKEIIDPKQFDEIVFCGYGEPLIRIDLVKSLSKKLIAARGSSKKPQIRVDTNGHANLFHQRNILPELKGLIDEIQISLNAENAKKYAEICRPIYGEKSYQAILDFAREAKKYIPNVILSVVDLTQIDKEACRLIATQLDVGFRIRPYYEEQYKK